MKKLKCLTLSFLLALSFNIKAQILTSASCSGATPFSPTNTPQMFEQNSNDGWLSFTASATSAAIKLKNIFNGTNGGKITMAQVYAGSCGTLNLISADSISLTNDTLLTITLNGLVVGNTYYIKSQKGVFLGQCNNPGNCSNNSVFEITVGGLYCGFSWGGNPVAPVGNPNPFGAANFNGFQYGCMDWNQPNANPITDPYLLACSNVNLCTNTLYVGYSPGTTYFGSNILQNYTLYVFPNAGTAYSVGVTFTTALNLVGATQFTIVASLSCQPPITPALTPDDLDGCACKRLVVTVAPPPVCNLTVPNPVCANQPFCFGGINNPNPPYVTNCAIAGTTFPNGCVPNGLPTGTYMVTYNAFLNTPVGGINADCQCNKTLTFSVGPPPLPITITSSANEVCIGKGVILTATPFGPTYTWQPGPTMGNPVFVTPQGNTTYTAYSGSGACISQGVITILTYTEAPTFTAVLSDPFVCFSNKAPVVLPSTTLSLSPPGAYTLALPNSPVPVPFSSTIVLSPTITSNYTVYAYNPSGCLTNSVVKVTVVPCACIDSKGAVLSGVMGSIFMPNAPYKVVSSVTLSIPLGNSSGGFIGNDVVVYPGAQITIMGGAAGTSTFNIAGTHIHGCGEMWEGIVLPYLGPQLNIIPYNPSPRVNKTTLIEDAKIAVHALNLPGGYLPPLPPKVLFIDNATFNKNIIGVKIENYQFADVDQRFVIQNSLFTSRSISVTPVPNGISSWPLTNNIKLTTNIGYNPVQTPYIDNTMFPPAIITSTLYNYFDFPLEGIELNYVGLTTQPGSFLFKSIKLGQAGVPNFNCFDNLYTDIYSYNSNLSVINAVFQNGRRKAGKGNAGTGVAIRAISDLNQGTNRNSLYLGSVGNGNFNCRFYEKTAAVDATDYFDIQIYDAQAFSLGNDYNNFLLANMFGDRGFNIKTNRYQNIIFQNNKLYNIKNAMMIGVNNQPGSGSNREIGQILVQDNVVDRSPTNVLYGAAPYVNIALSISDPVAAATNPIIYAPFGALVANNTFSRVNNGISVLNLNPTPIGINSNTVTLINEYPLFAPPAPTQIGIFAANCPKQTGITLNKITGPATWSTEMKALSTSFNASLSVRCNTTAYTERGIEFNGAETMDYFEDNWMSNQTYGLVLDNVAKLTSSFNNLNVMGANNRPTNNVWQHPWPGFKKTFTTGGSSAQNAKLYITYGPGNVDPDGSGSTTGNLNNAPFFNDNYFHLGAPWSPQTLLPSNLIVPTPIGCRIGNGGPGGGNPNLSLAILEQIAGPGYNYANNAIQHQTIDKNFAYRALKANPSLIVASPTLTVFYNNAQATSLQSMVSVEENLSNGNIALAQNQIAALSPTNTVENNYQNFYQIFKSSRDSALSSNDSLNLLVLANMCPYIDGAVVFQARALFNVLYTGFYKYTDNCNPANNARTSNIIKGKKEEKEINVILKSTLFPNPNDGNYMLKFKGEIGKQNVEITIFDITGKQALIENKVLENGNELNLSNNLLNGIYLLKVKLEDGSIDVHRLIINK